MNSFGYRLRILFASILLLPVTIIIAAETETPTETETTSETETFAVSEAGAASETKTPVVISPTDTTEAGKALHAWKEANPLRRHG